MPDAVAEAFLDALSPDIRGSFADVDVGAELRARWRRACDVHEDFGLELEPFARHVARRFVDGAHADALSSLHFGDLLLAWACLQQAPAALRRFDHAYAPTIEQVRRTVGLEIDAEEFRQRVYQRIFVSEDEGPPRISAFRGTGPLKAWVRMVASRLAIDERRRPAVAREELEASSLGEDVDVELDVLRGRYAPSFRAAFRESVEALDPDDRALLRLRYLHGLSVTELARLRGIHRVTMSRMLTAIRQTVFDAIVRVIGHHDGVPASEVASVLRLVRSRLDVSLSAIDY